MQQSIFKEKEEETSTTTINLHTEFQFVQQKKPHTHANFFRLCHFCERVSVWNERNTKNARVETTKNEIKMACHIQKFNISNIIWEWTRNYNAAQLSTHFIVLWESCFAYVFVFVRVRVCLRVWVRVRVRVYFSVVHGFLLHCRGYIFLRTLLLFTSLLFDYVCLFAGVFSLSHLNPQYIAKGQCINICIKYGDDWLAYAKKAAKK